MRIKKNKYSGGFWFQSSVQEIHRNGSEKKKKKEVLQLGNNSEGKKTEGL